VSGRAVGEKSQPLILNNVIHILFKPRVITE
jgi:hypothetical protein